MHDDTDEALQRLLAISPHLDDGVLACGELLAAHPDSVVLTVFAGVPPEEQLLTGWDADCGFASAREAIEARRAEDCAALQILHARPHWLEFLDDQYGCVGTDAARIAAQIRAALELHHPDAVLMPLGLFHRDHRLACEAALRVFDEQRELRWFAYEDALYRQFAGLLQGRLGELAARQVVASPASFAPTRRRAAKRRAVACYASQLRGLSTPGRPGVERALEPERYWRLSHPVPVRPAAPESPRISVVILTYNRADEVLRTVARMAALPEQPRLVVVDNGSADATAERLGKRFPDVRLVALRANQGAAARNAGVRSTDTPYVAFCDDDTFWAPGSLARAVEIMDQFPQVAVLSARVLVGAEQREDPTSSAMARSPFPSEGLPGRAVLGFLAGACVFRRSAFLEVGGYEPKFFIGAEEALMTLDLVSRGWSVVYAPQLRVHHLPSRQRNSEARRRLLARNALWVAWLRRPAPAALRRTLQALRAAMADRTLAAGCLDALRELPWVLRNRRVVPPHVETWCCELD